MTDRTFQKDEFTKASWRTKRRIMRTFKISEISGVDHPAQQGARMIFSKRADPDTDPVQTFAKVSFAAALDQRLLDRQYCEIFNEAFDNLWAANDAFREALKDQYQDGEEAARQYVDTVAQMASNAVAQTRGVTKGKTPDKSIFIKAVEDAVLDVLKRQKEPVMFKTLADLRAAIAKHLAGDKQDVKAIQKSAIDLGAVAELSGDLALTQPDPETAALKRKVAELSMTADVRKHYDALAESDKVAFLAKSETEQVEIVKALNAEDPVVYTTKAGLAIRKSEGATVAALAKQNDEQADLIAKLSSENSDAAFEKSARENYAYMPLDGTVEILKAAAAMSDEDKKKKMLEALQAANKAARPKFERIGGSMVKSSEPTGENPSDKLDDLAKAYMAKADTNMTFEKAYAAILETPEGKALYNESVGFEAE